MCQGDALSHSVNVSTCQPCLHLVWFSSSAEIAETAYLDTTVQQFCRNSRNGVSWSYGLDLDLDDSKSILSRRTPTHDDASPQPGLVPKSLAVQMICLDKDSLKIWTSAVKVTSNTAIQSLHKALWLKIRYHQTTNGCKRFSSSEATAESYCDHMSPHCDLNLEDGEQTFLHGTSTQDDASQSRVWLQQVEWFTRYCQDKTRTYGHTDRQTCWQKDKRFKHTLPSLCYGKGNNVMHTQDPQGKADSQPNMLGFILYPRVQNPTDNNKSDGVGTGHPWNNTHKSSMTPWNIRLTHKTSMTPRTIHTRLLWPLEQYTQTQRVLWPLEQHTHSITTVTIHAHNRWWPTLEQDIHTHKQFYDL